jgi:hypothetical protein
MRADGSDFVWGASASGEAALDHVSVSLAAWPGKLVPGKRREDDSGANRAPRFPHRTCSAIRRSEFGGRDAIRVKSIRDVVTLYRRKREAKVLDSDGYPCGRGTAGLLSRRSVRDLTILHIGKEANEIEDVSAGIASATDVTTAYTDPLRNVYSQLILPALLSFPEAAVARAAAIPRRTINGLRSGRRPDRGTLRQLVPALAKLCGEPAPDIDERDHLAALAAWRDRQPNLRICPACGDTPPAGRVCCRAACRQAAYRSRLTRRLAR